jgi:hypothetical protein
MDALIALDAERASKEASGHGTREFTGPGARQWRAPEQCECWPRRGAVRRASNKLASRCNDLGATGFLPTSSRTMRPCCSTHHRAHCRGTLSRQPLGSSYQALHGGHFVHYSSGDVKGIGVAALGCMLPSLAFFECARGVADNRFNFPKGVHHRPHATIAALSLPATLTIVR